MDKKNTSLTRRRFIAAGSAAIAAPIVMNIAGRVAEAGASEEKTYLINDNCILCPPLPCKEECPAGAISFDGDKFAIDAGKCVRCGNCMEVCEIGAVVDTSAPLPVHEPHDVIHRECDMLVVGGGTAGLIAAAIAADLSGKKVIVLEKAKRPGGSGFYANGIRFWSTKWQRDAGVPDQMDDYIRSAMNITRWELNPQLVENSFRALPALFDWFCTWGKAEEIWHLVDSRHSKRRKNIEVKNWEVVKSRQIMHSFIDRCKALGVDILTEHAATEFIMGDRGEVVGVKAKDPGGVSVFNCRYCLVATGNVINCSSLLARCAPEYVNALRRRSGHRLPTNTGDGVLMAEAAGIPVDYDNVCITFTGANSSLAEPQLRAFDQMGETLHINLHGERWVNESYIQLDTENGFLPTLLRQPKCMFYNIMDSKIVAMDPMPTARILTEGNAGGRDVEAGVPDPDEKGATAGNAGAMPSMASMPGSKKPDIRELERIAAMSGRHVVIADTLEELADKMGVDRKAFVSTVKRYNALCQKGRDDDYYKPAKYMLPIEKAPFYATSHFLSMDGAVGGLALDENMQVMGGSGPIENLYAAGDTTSSRFINRGYERIEIVNDMTWAAASGFLAGQNIGKQLKKS